MHRSGNDGYAIFREANAQGAADTDRRRRGAALALFYVASFSRDFIVTAATRSGQEARLVRHYC